MVNIRNQFVSAYRRGRKKLSEVTGTNYPFSHIPRAELANIIADNRRALAQIALWVDAQALQQSIFNYGITPQSLGEINAPTDAECTYADLLLYFAKHLRKPLRYLELGVSVGKTFWQVLCSSQQGQLVGFDIEKINPALERQLQRESQREWPVMAGSLKRTPTTLTTYRHAATQSDVSYLCGDIFDPAAWQALEGKRFNLIFSDAFHSADAVQKEWEMIRSLKLLDPDECVLLWDDLDGAMHDWFVSRKDAIAAALDTNAAQVCSIYVNGWLGQREWPHRVGLAIKGDFFSRSRGV